MLIIVIMNECMMGSGMQPDPGRIDQVNNPNRPPSLRLTSLYLKSSDGSATRFFKDTLNLEVLIYVCIGYRRTLKGLISSVPLSLVKFKHQIYLIQILDLCFLYFNSVLGFI